MVTPPSGVNTPPDSNAVQPESNKRKASGELVPDLGASPNLKAVKSSGINTTMQRTPQPNLTQPKITGFGISQGPTVSATPTETAMDQTPAAPQVPGTGLGESLNAEFFRSLLAENTKQITNRIDGLSGEVLALTRSVALNTGEIGKNSEEIKRQAAVIAQQKSALDELGGRVAALEATGGPVARCGTVAGTPSPAYLTARRSVRLWPVDRSSEDAMWRGVGDFIHSVLKISDNDVTQFDIESIKPLENPRVPAGNLHNEVLVTFSCPRKRDLLMSGTMNLAGHTDSSGRPTAGVRLEIPGELDATFRLLSRFGTRLRARHGEGTKRHIKFDDFESSLFMNIKLPGDEEWSKISPAMAKADLDQSSKAETAGLLRRIAKAPNSDNGPRRRLAAAALPAPAPAESSTTVPARATAGGTAASTGNVRPRPWGPRNPGAAT